MSLLIRRATPADEDVVVAFNAALAWESEHKKLDEPVLRAGVRAVRPSSATWNSPSRSSTPAFS